MLGSSTEEEQIDRILNTFRSQPWLVEHRWFVQWDGISGKECVNLYTLSYAFDDFHFSLPILSESTSPYDNNQRLYDCVQNLIHKSRFI
jgi:hypothetical protein